MWYVSEVARLKVVSPSIDGPNVALVIRFEHDGQERFARWIGGEDWRATRPLNLLFEVATRPVNEQDETTGVGPAPPETVRLWCERVKSMGPGEIDQLERRMFAAWDRASLGELRRAIYRRRQELRG